MARDDEAKDKNLERKKLLEEIKKRAEEAELKRIEEEEEKSHDEAPSSSKGSSPSRPASDQLVVGLHEKLNIALDRGIADKAAQLLAELSSLIPGDPELRKYQFRLAVLQENQQAFKVRKRSSDPKEKEEAARNRQEKELLRRRMAELLDQATSNYEQEKYSDALGDIDEILELDFDNEGALTLRKKIEKARSLADELKREEARQREAAEKEKKPAAKPLPVPVEKGNVWGAEITEENKQTVFVSPEEQAAAEGLKKSTLERLVDSAAKIHIPVKTLLTIVVVLVVGVTAYFVVDAIRTTVFPPKYSLLVFPAATTSSEEGSSVLAEGITEELIRRLEVIPDLRLIAPTTAFSFSDPRLQVPQTARSLEVYQFVQWVVDRTSEGVSIEVFLFDTLSVSSVWTKKYNCTVEEIPAICSEIARSLVGVLAVDLTPDQTPAFPSRPAKSAGAFEKYLQARYALRHPELFTNEQVIQAFEQARDLDPDFADAYGGLGWAFIRAAESKMDTARSLIQLSLRCVQQAMAHGGNSSEVSRVWGMAHFLGREYGNAIERFSDAVVNSPADAEAHRRFALASVINGNVDDAFVSARRALSLDPNNPESHIMLAILHQYVGALQARGQDQQRARFDSALVNFERGMRWVADKSEYAATHLVDLQVYLLRHDQAASIFEDRVSRMRESFVDYYKLARVYQAAGKPVDQWRGVLRKAQDLIKERLKVQPRDAFALSYLGLVHTRLGEFKEANDATRRAIETGNISVDVLYNIARVYALQKDKTQALTFLSQALDRHYGMMSLLDMDFFNLRQDADFLSTIIRE